ncbi:hypothetical protein Y032_1272g3794 [Ancylostoma ceylanicum]|uniref:Uncharacterized protein n=1 Tax=Ancylostoma ceylanicum TaxID=53326 RepID=A0A016W7E2_9BILA|nr:hypothetical protein Y032_1272g3794 [Ancylostoma ceylanicum]
MQEMTALFPCVEGADECSAVGCARVPPRNPVNCGHPPCWTTSCESVNWRVEPLKGRRGLDSDTCFSADGSPLLLFFSHS